MLVMPQLPVMMERYMICRSFGAEVHLTAPALGVVGMQVAGFSIQRLAFGV